MRVCPCVCQPPAAAGPIIVVAPWQRESIKTYVYAHTCKDVEHPFLSDFLSHPTQAVPPKTKQRATGSGSNSSSAGGDGGQQTEPEPPTPSNQDRIGIWLHLLNVKAPVSGVVFGVCGWWWGLSRFE
jgi:hypothetical protein